MKLIIAEDLEGNLVWITKASSLAGLQPGMAAQPTGPNR